MYRTNLFDGSILTVISGSMFSGKTTELLRLLRIAEIAGKKIRLFKPILDNRYAQDDVVSHDLIKKPAIAIYQPQDIFRHLHEDLSVIGIDEVQFMDETVVTVCRSLVHQGINVIAAGLNLDFRGEPFGPMPALLAYADNIIKLYAVCEQCGKPATRTQRLIHGQPASYHQPVISVGGAESYTPRCVDCHSVPDHPLSL